MRCDKTLALHVKARRPHVHHHLAALGKFGSDHAGAGFHQ